MKKKPSEQELIEIVRRLMAFKGTEEELSELLFSLKESVPHPAVGDLIFHPKKEMTAEDIVREALSYKPIQL